MTTEIPFAIKMAKSSFHSKRAKYYENLCWVLEASKGETKMLTIFEKDAQRYAGKPRGTLAAHWVERYSNNGADLADAWSGTLPDDEVSIIRVAQNAGKGALESALKDLARIATLSDEIKSQVKGTLFAAVMGMAIALTMVFIFPIFASQKLQEIYSFIPLDQWGPNGTRFNAHADRVTKYGVYVVAATAIILTYLSWTINNWIGPMRDWADKHIVLYRTVRDIKGALFLATMSTLTRRRGNTSFTLTESLSVLSESIRSRWLQWRVDEIRDRVDQTGGVGSDSFETNLLSEEMFFFLRDTQEALGFAEGFEQTGKFVESEIVGSIVQKMTIYRWVVLLVAVLLAVGVVGSVFSVIYEMKSVMSLFYSSR